MRSMKQSALRRRDTCLDPARGSRQRATTLRAGKMSCTVKPGPFGCSPSSRGAIRPRGRRGPVPVVNQRPPMHASRSRALGSRMLTPIHSLKMAIASSARTVFPAAACTSWMNPRPRYPLPATSRFSRACTCWSNANHTRRSPLRRARSRAHVHFRGDSPNHEERGTSANGRRVKGLRLKCNNQSGHSHELRVNHSPAAGP